MAQLVVLVPFLAERTAAPPTHRRCNTCVAVHLSWHQQSRRRNAQCLYGGDSWRCFLRELVESQRSRARSQVLFRVVICGNTTPCSGIGLGRSGHSCAAVHTSECGLTPLGQQFYCQQYIVVRTSMMSRQGNKPVFFAECSMCRTRAGIARHKDRRAGTMLLPILPDKVGRQRKSPGLPV